jgi:hypothetical protein
VVAEGRLQADLVQGRGAQRRHQLPQALDLGRQGGLGVLDPGHGRRVAEHPLLGPLQVVGEHGQALDGPVMELGGDMHALLLGRLHGPVEHRRRSASARSIARTSPAMRAITSTSPTG